MLKFRTTGTWLSTFRRIPLELRFCSKTTSVCWGLLYYSYAVSDCCMLVPRSFTGPTTLYCHECHFQTFEVLMLVVRSVT